MRRSTKYMRNVCETFKVIPKRAYIDTMLIGDSELDCEFLCFEENYIPVAPFIPDDWIVVDLGCYQAAQAYHFTKKAGYVGVDYFEQYKSADYNPPARFKPRNAVHMYESIQTFLQLHLRYFDLSKTYFIMSGVPDSEATALAYSKVKNALLAYPGQPIRAKGINASKIGGAIRKFKSEQFKKEVG